MAQHRRSVILYEPDEPLRADCAAALSRAGWHCEIISTPDDAVKRRFPEPLRVVFLDADERGDDLSGQLGQICLAYPESAVVMMAGEMSETSLLCWLRAGVRDVLRKPFDGARIVALAQQWLSEPAAPEAGTSRCAVAAEMAARQVLSNAVHALVQIMEAKDKYCVGYAKAVAALCEKLAGRLRLEPRLLHALRIGALLHDIGRVGLQDEVVNKRGSLTPTEQAHVSTHVLLGEQILKHLFSDQEVLSLVRHHHEWYNGRGYPDGLKGEEIPLEARILAVADAYVAMIQERPHRRRKVGQEALREVCLRVNTQFCPTVVGALLEVLGYRRPGSPGEEDEEAVAEQGTESEAAAGEDVGDGTPPQARPVAKDDLERRINRVVELRAMSAVVADVMNMTARQDVNVDELAAKIKCDHALATKLLRLANSALYGSRMKVESIDRAVLKLGMDRVRQLVLGIGVIGQWRQSQKSQRMAHDLFWRHSMSTALLARQIAVLIDYPEEQNAFTAGLLHDVGQLVLQEALGAGYAAILAKARDTQAFLPEVERRYLDSDHAAVMQPVGCNWGLPESLIQVMVRHHAPWAELQGMDPSLLQLLLCVRIADNLSHAMRIGESGLGSIELVPASFIDFLRLDRGALDDILAGVPTQVLRLGEAYGLSAEDGADPAGPKRRPPQRAGHYIREGDVPVDPVSYYLAAEGAEFDVTSGPAAWKNNAENTWCWVLLSSPAFAKEIIGALQDVPGDADKARRNLLLLLPAGAPDAARQLLAKAGIQFAVEPWSISALDAHLNRMRAVRPEAVEAAPSPSQ